VNVAVIGAGLAGLAAACELADRGHSVTVYEARPWAGGKTYSFEDRETGDVLDNGQHVFMACTTAYIAFLRRLGTLHLTWRQPRLDVPVFDARGRPQRLRALPLPAPAHLGPSFATYGHLAARDRVSIARALIAAWWMRDRERRSLRGITFGEWLAAHGQSAEAIRDFWDFAILPTLNCRSSDASAADALFVFRRGFLQSNTGAALGIPRVPLRDLHVEPAIRYIEQRGGRVLAGERVAMIEVSQGRARALQTTGGSHHELDAVVVAVPHDAVARLLPAHLAAEAPFASLAAIPSAPIVNLHLWFDRPVADWPFAAFLGNDLQWVFNRRVLDVAPGRGYRLTVSVSSAGQLLAMSPDAVREHMLPQLHRAIPGTAGAKLTRFRLTKEPAATFVPAPGLERPGNLTPIANLVLAGAYTATGWPATMESAVRSGLRAAWALSATP
jgi:squalene-associated FAD-dependent desaturase